MSRASRPRQVRKRRTRASAFRGATMMQARRLLPGVARNPAIRLAQRDAMLARHAGECLEAGMQQLAVGRMGHCRSLRRSFCPATNSDPCWLRRSPARLRDDSVRLDAKIRAAHGVSLLRIWPAVPHAWPIFNVILPEGRQALDESAVFIRYMVSRSTDEDG